MGSINRREALAASVALGAAGRKAWRSVLQLLSKADKKRYVNKRFMVPDSRQDKVKAHVQSAQKKAKLAVHSFLRL